MAYQEIDDCQSQSEAAVGPNIRGVHLSESLKNMRQMLRGDPHSRIRHCQSNLCGATVQGNLDHSTIRRKFNGVREQVRYDLLQASRISENRSSQGIDFRFELQL